MLVSKEARYAKLTSASGVHELLTVLEKGVMAVLKLRRSQVEAYGCNRRHWSTEGMYHESR